MMSLPMLLHETERGNWRNDNSSGMTTAGNNCLFPARGLLFAEERLIHFEQYSLSGWCDEALVNVTSGQIQRYVLFPAVIPTCGKKHTTGTCWGITPGSSRVWDSVFLQYAAITDATQPSFSRSPRIRRLRIGRPRKLAAMFPGTYTTPETSRLLARKENRQRGVDAGSSGPPTDLWSDLSRSIPGRF